MLRSKPLMPAVADAVLLGLATLVDADADVPQLEARVDETLAGLFAVCQMALEEVIVATGEGADAALAELRATALKMADEDFAESAETMWAAGFLEASRAWPDLYTRSAVNAMLYGDGGLGGAATILMLMAAKHCGITEQELTAHYRALAIESLAAA